MICKNYIAGIFDGEGFFTFRRVKGGNKLTVRPWRFQAYAHIVMRDGWLLSEISSFLGYGVISTNREATEKHAKYIDLMLTGESLKRFCVEIGPLLRLKNRQATLMLEVCEIKKRVGNQPVSDADYYRQEEIWEEQRILNKKGPDYKDQEFVKK